MPLTWLFFSISGRLSRAAYFLAGMLLAIAQAFPLYRFMLVPEDSSEAQMWASLFAVLFVASLWCNVALAVKRLHDFSKPGILALSLFVPIVSIAAFLLLLPVSRRPRPPTPTARAATRRPTAAEGSQRRQSRSAGVVTAMALSAKARPMNAPTDPAATLAPLIRCPSVTPAEGGALAALSEHAVAARLRSRTADVFRARHAGRREPLCAGWGTTARI